MMQIELSSVPKLIISIIMHIHLMVKVAQWLFHSIQTLFCHEIPLLFNSNNKNIGVAKNYNQFFLIIIGICLFCSGGNQRDLARAKAQKKLADAKKGNRTDNLTVEQRKAR